MSDLNSNTIENEEQDENKSGEGDESDEDPSQLPSSNNTFPTQDVCNIRNRLFNKLIMNCIFRMAKQRKRMLVFQRFVSIMKICCLS
jgi:hypothetical protein